MLQCLLPCMVYVKSGAQFCDYWTTAACKPSEVRSSPVNYFTAHLLIHFNDQKNTLCIYSCSVLTTVKREEKNTLCIYLSIEVFGEVLMQYTYSVPYFFAIFGAENKMGVQAFMFHKNRHTCRYPKIL